MKRGCRCDGLVVCHVSFRTKRGRGCLSTCGQGSRFDQRPVRSPRSWPGTRFLPKRCWRGRLLQPVAGSSSPRNGCWSAALRRRRLSCTRRPALRPRCRCWAPTTATTRSRPATCWRPSGGWHRPAHCRPGSTATRPCLGSWTRESGLWSWMCISTHRADASPSRRGCAWQGSTAG